MMSTPFPPFASAAVPATFVPMKLSLIVAPLPVTRMPSFLLPEITLPKPSLPPMCALLPLIMMPVPFGVPCVIGPM